MPARDELGIKEFRPIIVSEKASWQRWLIIVLLVLFLMLQAASFATAHQAVDRSKDSRPLLCGIGWDVAVKYPQVAAAYEQAGCVTTLGPLLTP